MFAGGSPREDTQDLFPAGTDEQEELSENQNVSAFRNTLFSRLQELSVIRQQEELFSEKQDTQNLLQELFQTGHASEQKLLSQDNSKDQDMFPESSAIKSQHENRLSEYHISQQPILSETSDGQQDDESRVFGGGDEQRNAEDIISGTVDNQATFTSGQITQHIGENVCSAGSVDEHCDFFERSATGQDAFSGNLNLGQQVLSASRASLRLNPRVAPRQLHMGKCQVTAIKLRTYIRKTRPMRQPAVE
ncbi:hypothetical protein Cfor_05411 [Coptotermes formosanus]|jgi:hypothetical protein|uniref:Uncharacterized protein n=1 Tax=Coptotermes formosanus TaxID=36987 RepID=A0A6L2PWI8_COPFO|nr:hypothetical protein Cfor_05411 [Coptotermes formosanus]